MKWGTDFRSPPVGVFNPQMTPICTDEGMRTDGDRKDSWAGLIRLKKTGFFVPHLCSSATSVDDRSPSVRVFNPQMTQICTDEGMGTYGVRKDSWAGLIRLKKTGFFVPHLCSSVTSVDDWFPSVGVLNPQMTQICTDEDMGTDGDRMDSWTGVVR